MYDQQMAPLTKLDDDIDYCNVTPL